MTIYNIMKRIREEKKLSLEEVSRITQIPLEHVQDIEEGRLKATVKEAILFSRLYDKKISEIWVCS